MWFSQEQIHSNVKSSSDDNNLPVIVSVTGGYVEPADALEQPDLTQWVHVFANWYCLWNYSNVEKMLISAKSVATNTLINVIKTVVYTHVNGE